MSQNIICTIFAVSPESTEDKKYGVGSVQKHYDMHNWLKEHGKQDWVYELHRGESLHSCWEWKDKTERWGRMATPKKKSSVYDTSSPKSSNDKTSRKKVRKERAMSNRRDRRPRA